MHLLTVTIDHSGTANLGHAGLYTATYDLTRIFTESGLHVSEVCFGHQECEPHNGAHRITPQKAAKLLSDGEISAIYTQYIQPGLPLELAAMGWPHVVPVISICHDLVNAMDPILAWSASPGRHPADIAVISSEAGSEALKKLLALAGVGSAWPAVDVEVLPLGTFQPTYDGTRQEAREKNDWREEEVIFLWIGRFSETYKADLRPLFLAFRELLKHEQIPNVKLVAIGADTTGMAVQLENMARQLEILPYCTILPNADIETRNRYLAGADILVNVSDHIQETFGLVNIEAMANGLPVIAGDWSGFRNLIKDGVNGILIPTKLDSTLLDGVNIDTMASLSIATSLDFSSLVAAMKRLGSNSALRTKMGKAAALEVSLNYSWKALAPRYIKLIQQRVELAKNATPRRSPRPWMSHVFSHYGTISLHGKYNIFPGRVPLQVALRTVESKEIREKMEHLYTHFVVEKRMFSWKPIINEELIPLHRVALMTLLKLGVLEIVVASNEK